MLKVINTIGCVLLAFDVSCDTDLFKMLPRIVDRAEHSSFAVIIQNGCIDWAVEGVLIIKIKDVDVVHCCCPLLFGLL
jgi:hypothetical protein